MKHPPPGIFRFLTRPLVPCMVIALLCLSPGGLGLVSSTWAQERDEGAEVLTRGPVHEGFAGTIAFKASPGILVSQAPPAAIEEIPPDQRPEGDNVTWIPGYWAWDDEGNNFLWVSGIWRNLPPGRQWMPGYWSESGQDYQWISGYWADATAGEVEYLDEPPASIEAGPNIKAPSRNHTWIPGVWRWRETRYLWQPGYWNEVQPDWVWVPSYYTSSPRGYIYVDGYYDYDVPRRGMVFAPVRFTGNYYSRPDYSYRPSTVISITALVDHLFLRPRSRHYYFGDYYAADYRRSGYYPSYNYYSGGYGYDPIYAHQRWTHRDDDRWERRNEENFTYYRDHQEARPPRTLSALSTFLARPDDNRRVEAGYATRLDQLVRSKDSRLKLKAVDEAEKKSFSQRGREIRDFGDQRRKLGVRSPGESDTGKSRQGEAAKDGKNRREPTRVKIPASPIVAKGSDSRNPEDTPPERPKVSRGENQPDNRPGSNPRQDSKENSTGGNGRKGQSSKDSRKDVGGEPKETRPDRAMDPAVKPNAPPKNPERKDPRESRNQEPQREPKAGPKQESDPAGSKESPKRESRGDSKRESPNTEPRREVPKAAPRAEPRREAPKAEPRAEPRREAPKAEPRAEPRREAPKAAPRAEPRREAPKAAPKAEPRREPKRAPEPKADPRPAPKAPAPESAAPKKKAGKPEDKDEKDKRR